MSQWDKIEKKTGLKAVNIARATLIQMTNNIVRMSPVKKGRFVNNWNSSINTEDLSTNDGEDKSRGKSIARATAEASKTTIGDVFYFYNNLPYAIPLEYGHSDQARNPDGMVRITVAQFQHIVDVRAK